MKIISAFILLFSLSLKAQTTSGQFELDSAVFRNDNIGVLAFDVIVDQDLQNFDQRDIEKLKVTLIEAMFGGENLEVTASVLSLKRDSNPISTEERYTVNQLQLLSARIVKVVPLSKGFRLTLSAHAGLGFSVKGVVNQNNETVSEAEYQLFKLARECMDCVKETIRTVGYYPVEAGIRIQLNKNNSYIAFSGDYRQSGKETTIPGQDRLILGTDPYRTTITESNTIIPLSFELGHQIASGPVTVYARGERISYRSSVDLSGPGADLPGVTDQSTDHYAFRVGVRIKLRGLFR